jgi:NAD(P)-dependent dehydrogenase (short-subunit alcohol dehydrogenase family)
MKRTVIITGAAGNLGKAAVEKFLKEECRVVGTVSPGKSLGYNVSGEVSVHEVDLTNEQDAEALVESVVRTHQNIDVAVLTVGGYGGGGIGKTDGSGLRKMYSLNFETAYFLARPVFLKMVKQSSGGRIVLIGSRTALEPLQGKSALAYTLSKSLLFNLAACLNAEAAGKNVVTSVIVPSVLDTPENRKSMPNANFSEWVLPERVADILYFITSEQGKPLSDPVVKIYGNL